MPLNTTNYQLKKPYYSESADVGVINQNFDSVDDALTPTISQTTAPTSASTKGKVSVVLGWLANRIKAITGKTNWYDTPAVTLETCNTHINSDVHTIVTTSKNGVMSAADKQKLDYATASYTAGYLMLRDAYGRAQVQNPSASYDIMNKTYADSYYLRLATASTMSAMLTAQSNTSYTTRQVRNIVFWTSGTTPPTTSYGDVIIKTF